MRQLNQLAALSTEKKLILKVIVGVLILTAAFLMYMAKHADVKDSLWVTEISSGSAVQSGQTLPEKDPLLSGEDSQENLTNEIFVDVSGAVLQPSVFVLKTGSRVFEAIALAGGLRDDADTRNINLAQVLNDGEKLYLPTKKEVESGLVSDATASSTATSGADSAGRVNLNTADAKALQQLSGVGPSTAEKIVDYRNSHGKFKKIEDLQKVSGIGAKTFEKLKDKITV